MMNLKVNIILTLCLRYGLSDTLVQLPSGTIRGKESSTISNRTFYSFLKVPYAAPPINDLRFKPPEPPQNWSDILDATSNYVLCYQVNIDYSIESEDCLYLNIFTPQLPDDSQNLDFPVLFYIHGGGFIQGTCLDFVCGPDFLIERDIVVVTINYRLGPFGFLSTGDTVIPGNNGLKDQHLGIKWTYDNIKLFGGDPKRITLVGQSAGAASITYQFLNKNSEGLFWGAICQSGSFLNPWGFQRKPREIAFKTASFLNDVFNYNNSSQELLDFLQSVPARKLDEASLLLHQTENLENRQMSEGFFYAPVLEPEHDGAFITRKMYTDLKTGNFVKVPIMIGINSEEALEDAGDLTLLENILTGYDENLEWLVPNSLNVQNETEKQQIGNLIRSFYTDSTLRENLAVGVKIFSDNSFTRSIVKHADLQSKFTDVYFYQFSYDGIVGDVSINLAGTDKVAHSEENRYLWRIVFNGYDNTNVTVFPESDVITHRRLIRLWTDFVKTSNPTPQKLDLLQNITWPKFTNGRPKDFLYLDIGSDLSIRNYPKIGSYLGWNLIYNTIGHDDFDTY